MNNEKNINGFPNVNNVKIEDTPAESFASIYGNGGQSQQPMPTQPFQQTVAPQPQPTQPVQQTVAPQPVPTQLVQQTVAPQPVSTQPVQQTVAPQPQPTQPVQPTVAPQPQPTQPVQQTVAPQPTQPVQPVQVDADRLQSIEEQLSKTSQYKPEDFQQEKIEIPTTNEYEKNKSGISFVIVLFIILALAIIASPFITKFFS